MNFHQSYDSGVSPRRRTVVLIFVASTLTGLYFASQAMFNPAISELITWREALTVNLMYYYVCGLSAPVIFMLARRFPLQKPQLWRSLFFHVAASVVVTTMIVLATEIFLTLIGFRHSSLAEVVPYAFSANFHSLLPTYWLILLSFVAFQLYEKYRDRELRSAQLEASLSEARLDALKMQLRPHFLFNTLNSISSLMYQDVRSADAMITRLGDFLRLTLDTERSQLIPLHRELEFVRRYLEIEKIRFEKRLEVEFEIGPSLENALVPALVLQPLVENAIHHGLASRAGDGRIAISARAVDHQLLLRVEDNGNGAASIQPEQLRVGLGNTRARLEYLYPGRHQLRFEKAASGGFAVEIATPLQMEEEPHDSRGSR